MFPFSETLAECSPPCRFLYSRSTDCIAGAVYYHFVMITALLPNTTHHAWVLLVLNPENNITGDRNSSISVIVSAAVNKTVAYYYSGGVPHQPA